MTTRIERMGGLFAGLLVLAVLSGEGEAAGGIDRLKEAVAHVVEQAPGEMGVAIEHLETGQAMEVNGNRAFPLASTFKVAILVELFNQVDEGRVDLGEMVTIRQSELHLGSGQLKEFRVPGVILSIENLVYLMMRISDNSATDILLERVGVEHVNRRLRTLGIDGMRIDRSTQQLILEHLGFSEELATGRSYEELMAYLNAYQPAPGELELARTAFADDLQDVGTPTAMNRLLAKVFHGEAASAASCQRMVEIMLECDTGRSRIPGLLPSDAKVAHKTGTIGGTVNDVGVVILPDGRGHVAISLLSKKMSDREAAEKALADIARYAYDFFLFTAPGPKVER